MRLTEDEYERFRARYKADEGTRSLSELVRRAILGLMRSELPSSESYALSEKLLRFERRMEEIEASMSQLHRQMASQNPAGGDQ